MPRGLAMHHKTQHLATTRLSPHADPVPRPSAETMAEWTWLAADHPGVIGFMPFPAAPALPSKKPELHA